MLTIPTHILHNVLGAKCRDDIYDHLQAAIELEHSTIPPYLTALYSIKPGYNQKIAEILRSVVQEEMLHMSILANILNAIGGKPQINHPKFIPVYPDALPMNIDQGLVVGLAPLSKKVVKDVFMAIEEPENPLRFGVASFTALKDEEFATIGQFYRALIYKFQELGSGCFQSDPDLQISIKKWFPDYRLDTVVCVDTAIQALNFIIQDGEGTEESPLDPEGSVAHYYRFEQIYKGHKLTLGSDNNLNFSYSGDDIPFDEDGIWNLVENSKADLYVPGTRARRLVDRFNFSYTKLLNALHHTFNGKPDHMLRAMGLMHDLKIQAQRMVEITEPNLKKQVTPSFEYQVVPV